MASIVGVFVVYLILFPFLHAVKNEKNDQGENITSWGTNENNEKVPFKNVDYHKISKKDFEWIYRDNENITIPILENYNRYSTSNELKHQYNTESHETKRYMTVVTSDYNNINDHMVTKQEYIALDKVPEDEFTENIMQYGLKEFESTLLRNIHLRIIAYGDKKGAAMLEEITKEGADSLQIFKRKKMNEDLQPLESHVIRHRFVIATKLLANYFHKNFERPGMSGETEKANFLVNSCEITTLLSFFILGKENSWIIFHVYYFTRAPLVDLKASDVINAVSEYIYQERYDKTADNTRKITLGTTFFLRNNFTIRQNFRNYAAIRFKTTFIDINRKRNKLIKKMIRDYVSRKTGGLIQDTTGLLEIDFDVRIVATTYIRGTWAMELEEEKHNRTFYCVDNDRQYKMKTNTKELITDYYDYGDRFAVYLPLNNSNQGILFYVPKTIELFEKMDKNMDFNDMYDILHRMEQRSVKIIFPMFDVDIERDFQYESRFLNRSVMYPTNETLYDNMTTLRNLYADSLKQRNVLKLDIKAMRYASVTFLSLRKNRELENVLESNTVPSFPLEFSLSLLLNSSNAITNLIDHESTFTSDTIKGNMLDARNLSLHDMNNTVKSNISNVFRRLYLPGDKLVKTNDTEIYSQSFITEATTKKNNQYKRSVPRKHFRLLNDAIKIICKPNGNELENDCKFIPTEVEECERELEAGKGLSENCHLLVNTAIDAKSFDMKFLRRPTPKRKIRRRTLATTAKAQEKNITVLINTSFFYAIINRVNGIFYGAGKINCP